MHIEKNDALQSGKISGFGIFDCFIGFAKGLVQKFYQVQYTVYVLLLITTRYRFPCASSDVDARMVQALAHPNGACIRETRFRIFHTQLDIFLNLPTDFLAHRSHATVTVNGHKMVPHDLE
jgi:hypothetical protein